MIKSKAIETLRISRHAGMVSPHKLVSVMYFGKRLSISRIFKSNSFVENELLCLPTDVKKCSNIQPKFDEIQLTDCQHMEFANISDRRAISSRISHSLSGLEFIFNHFLNLINFANMSTGRFLSQRVNCNFKSIKKLHRDILDLLNKSKTPSHCRFPLANLHFVESVDYRACSYTS
jgi:hypothetical protein